MKYIYEIHDSNGKVTMCGLGSREQARESRRVCEACAEELAEALGEVPPYKIVRFEKVNPKVIR